MTKNTIFTRLAMVMGILILLNFVANKFFIRLDFTADKRFTLSDATNDILKKLDKPVTITAFFSENLPADIGQLRTDFYNQLEEFEQRSGGKVIYEFVNPNADEEAEMRAQKAGVQPLLVNMRERDQIKQQRAYLGAVVSAGDENEVIPVIQPGAAMEYAVASSIKKVSVLNKPKIGFIQGHGEPTLEAMAQARQSLTILYDVVPVTMSDTSTLSAANYKTIAIVAPKDTFPQTHLIQFDAYLREGGKIYIAMNRVDGNLQNQQGTAITIMLEQWLQSKGVTVEDNFVRDSKCGAVTVRQQNGFMTFNTQVNFPYFPLISHFADHPITKGLEGVMMPFASSISFQQQDTSLMIVPIAMSSEQSNTQKAPVMFNVMQQWKQADFPLSYMPVAVAISGSKLGNSDARIVLVGDGDFAVNGEGQNQMQLQPDNVSLMVNSIDWLSDDTGLIELRTKGVTTRPLDKIEDGTKTMVKYSNVLAPIILIIIYGFVRYQGQQRKRTKWMEGDF